MRKAGKNFRTLASSGFWELAEPRLRPVRHGFTLIELLVVVSIIALLMSILLPSLKRARDQAKAVTCTSTIGGILRGMNIYASEWNGWIPGSPGTSGSVLLEAGLPTDLYLEDLPGNVSQTWDWAGPISGTALDANRGKRFQTIAEDLYVCPANQFTSEPYPDGPKGTFVNQRMMSYNTIRQYLLWSPEHPNGDFDPDYQWGDPAPFPEADFRYNLGGTELPPRNYVPNLGRVINPSAHVYIADGSRYTDTETGSVILDHDVDWNASAGGAFSDGGPTLHENFLRAYKTQDQWAAYSYRHSKSGDKGAIVTGRFDGSAGVLGRRESRFPDWWWPRGTLIPAIAEFNAEVKGLYGDNGQNNSENGSYTWKVYN